MLVQAKSSLVFPAVLSVQNPAVRSLYLLYIDINLETAAGVCFQDVYLNDDWQITDKSPFNDCYVMVEYKY